MNLRTIIALVVVLAYLTACPTPSPLPVPDVVITTSDSSSPKDPCAAADAISQARLIRGDGGMPLVVPCP